MSEFLDGFRFFFRGFRFLRQHRLWPYVFVPSLLSLCVGLGILWGAYTVLAGPVLRSLNDLVAGIAGYGGLTYSGLPAWLEGGLKLIVFSASFIVQLIAYRTIASILVIPFLGPLLSAVERIETGRAIEVSFATDLRNTIRGLGVGIRLGVFGLLLLLISIFLGPFQVVVNAVAQSYVLGRSAFDLVFEKETEDAHERRAMLRAYRAPILGLGLAFFLLMLVPVLGVVLAPAAGTAGAALLFHRKRAGSRPLSA